jgi:hypothetical protein
MPIIYVNGITPLQGVTMPICTPVSKLLEYVANKMGILDATNLVACMDTEPRVGSVLSGDTVVYDAANRNPNMKFMVMNLEPASAHDNDVVVDTPPRKKRVREDESPPPAPTKAPRIRKQTATLTKMDMKRLAFTQQQQRLILKTVKKMPMPKQPFIPDDIPTKDGINYIVVPVHLAYKDALREAGVPMEYVTAPCYLHWMLVLVPCGTDEDYYKVVYQHMVDTYRAKDTPDFFSYLASVITMPLGDKETNP